MQYLFWYLAGRAKVHELTFGEIYLSQQLFRC